MIELRAAKNASVDGLTFHDWKHNRMRGPTLADNISKHADNTISQGIFSSI